MTKWLTDDEDAQGPVEYDDEENEIPRTTFTGFKDKRKGYVSHCFILSYFFFTLLPPGYRNHRAENMGYG